jgi:pyrroline-5-carboxylate reductase
MRKFVGNICLVGAGQMGGAMLKGWLKAGLSPTQVQVRDPSPPPAMVQVINEYKIALNEAFVQPDYLILAIKPQMADKVLASLPKLNKNCLVLSIMAGKTIEGLSANLGGIQSIIRTIPNTPSSVGRGITAAFKNQYVIPSQESAAQILLQSLGQVVWVENESQIDAATAVSGSGPAYVFHMVEALAKAGEAQGLPQELAMRLARATIEGAGELLWQNQEVAASTLRENVTSPNGTTDAALQVLMGETGLTPLMVEAVAAATKRSKELAS